MINNSTSIIKRNATSHLKKHNKKNITKYNVENLGPDLKPAEKCGGVK